MVDVVALASVISTGTVAVGSLVVTYRAGREQRKHEAGLAFEARVWDKKSEGLFGVIYTCRALLDEIEQDDDGRFALAVARAEEGLERWVGVVEAYSSKECRDAFTELRALVDNAGLPTAFTTFVEIAREKKMKAIDAQDFEGAASARDKEKQTMLSAAAQMTLDRATAKQAASRLIEAARVSVRRPDTA